MRYTLPQPFEDLDHTADAGVVVRGATAEEALARLVLAYTQLVTGGGPLTAVREETLAIGTGEEGEAGDARTGGGANATEPAGDLALVAVNALRELHARFATAGDLAASCEVERLTPRGALLRIGFGAFDRAAHRDGLDIKAVTFHGARFEPDGEGWRAAVIFDI